MDISGDLKRYGKTDNNPAAEAAKATIRRNVLEAIGAEQAHVFDAFAGEGKMYRAVWRDAASYVGCDKDFFPDDRLAFAYDNQRVMRAIDLRPFNIVDLDAHGSPWETAYILAVRRPLTAGERMGLVLTEGTGLKMNMGGVSKGLALLAGVRSQMPGMGAARNEVIERALKRLCETMHAAVVRRWEAHGNKGSRVGYIGLVLEAA
jgi:hypothetical protein